MVTKSPTLGLRTANAEWASYLDTSNLASNLCVAAGSAAHRRHRHRFLIRCRLSTVVKHINSFDKGNQRRLYVGPSRNDWLWRTEIPKKNRPVRKCPYSTGRVLWQSEAVPCLPAFETAMQWK